MHYGPESLKSEGMLAVEITENDRQQPTNVTTGKAMMTPQDTNLEWQYFMNHE